ncbi:hypothetical protein MTO96_000790 [Rhipicephalus appendiculatus]
MSKSAAMDLLDKIEWTVVLGRDLSSELEDAHDVAEQDDCLHEITEKCKNYVDGGSRARQLCVLLIGVAALKLFVQCNWTGPAVEVINDIFPNPESDECRRACLKALEVSGEPPYHLIEQAPFLIIADALLVSCSEMLRGCCSVDWWAWRCAYAHQLVMLDRSQELHSEICDRIGKVEKNLPSPDEGEEQRKLRMLFCIEAALSYVHYFEVRNSRSYLDSAKSVSNIDFQLTGALGKRTYHQENELPQLLLEVKHKENDDVCTASSERANCFPKNAPLRDDTVMNEIKFSASAAADVSLTPEEGCLLLAVCILNKSISAPDALRDEEVMAYIERVLSVPRSWSVQFSALFQRCRLERNNSRRVPPKSALDVFLKYELWEDVINCYTKIGRRDRAEKVVRKLLEEEETAHLYCLLGDATQDPENYTKAWEISGHTSARAQRSLGLFYYNKKEFQEAIPYLQKSSELNGIQMNVWFALGYSAMQVENYALSVKAYKRVVNLDPESFEAWNNMASAYIHMGDKHKAWKVLQEALKCSYDNWRVWENYLLVCMDVGAFEECITSWHRLIDIKGKHSDGKVAKAEILDELTPAMSSLAVKLDEVASLINSLS